MTKSMLGHFFINNEKVLIDQPAFWFIYDQSNEDFAGIVMSFIPFTVMDAMDWWRSTMNTRIDIDQRIEPW